MKKAKIAGKPIASVDNFMSLIAVGTLISGLIVAGLLSRSPQFLNSQAAAPQKISICHIPPGNPEAAVTISVSMKAWETGHDPHNAHQYDFVLDEGFTCPPSTEDFSE